MGKIAFFTISDQEGKIQLYLEKNIINDFVINHVHENHEYYQNNPEWFRDGCVLGTAGCDWTERALDGVFSSYMPDVNWQNPEASEKFLEDAIWWQKEFDLDGSRIDAVKHVEPSAISNLVVKFNYELENSLTDYYLIGETAMGWSGDNLVDNLFNKDVAWWINILGGIDCVIHSAWYTEPCEYLDSKKNFECKKNLSCRHPGPSCFRSSSNCNW